MGNVSEFASETDFGGYESQIGGALWFEVSFHDYVSETSWETAFSDNKFEAGTSFWCEKLFERLVSESSWETAFSDNMFESGMATPKFNLPGSFHMKEEQKTKALSHQFWEDFYLRFLQASWEVELLIFLCNVAVLVAFGMLQMQAFKVGAKTHKVSGEVEEEKKKEEEEEFIETDLRIEEVLEEKRHHAFSQLYDEEKEENGEEKDNDKEEGKDEDMLSLRKILAFRKMPSRSLWKELATQLLS